MAKPAEKKEVPAAVPAKVEKKPEAAPAQAAAAPKPKTSEEAPKKKPEVVDDLVCKTTADHGSGSRLQVGGAAVWFSAHTPNPIPVLAEPLRNGT